MQVKKTAQVAREVSGVVAVAATDRKNAALAAMARKLAQNRRSIMDANSADIAAAQRDGLRANLIDRLGFGRAKIDARIRALKKIESLADPVGKPCSVAYRPNGLKVARVRVPLGVILMIYEARPHVTINAGAFCLKSGNAAILRGGSEAKRCNDLLGKLWREALQEAGLPGEAIQIISGSHEEIGDLLRQDQFIDLVIPRGGKSLIEAVSKRSKIPVVKHFSGVCHVYFDRIRDTDQAVDIALDSKCLMPEVCNAMETLLVHRDLSSEVPKFVNEFRRCGVQVRGCKETKSLVPDVEPATRQDWRTEYLDNIVSVRVVADVDEAIEHINTYGSGHTDTIVTDSIENADRFIQYVDSGVVLVNASTMFCDGEALGMGAEIGISTDKLHARGPMGLEELTSYKFVIHGSGHIMGEPYKFRKKRK